MKVKFKKLAENAIIPTKAHKTDAGFDLTATSATFDNDNGTVKYRTGLAVEIPEGHVGLLFPRSSICKYDLALTNSVGVIDSGYRGEITFQFKWANNFFRPQSFVEKLALRMGYIKKDKNSPRLYNVGERIGQLIIIPYPEVEFEESKELSGSDRGNGGYGSTGK